MAKVRHGLRDHPDVAGKRALFGRVGGNYTAFSVAFDELDSLGEIANLGTKGKPRLRLQGQVNP